MPVENVSWLDCQEFLRRLNRQVPGGGFRLPSEAEWEYAATSGGSVAVEEQSWSHPGAGGRRDGISHLVPRPVGTKSPNRMGLYDMLGNVQEWCSTLFRPYVYAARDGREDPGAPGLRVLRGGTYADGADWLDPALRHSDRPDRRFRWNGIRLARDIPAEHD
jgi:formylglycine-generating enzyme required for sulfatase activity